MGIHIHFLTSAALVALTLAAPASAQSVDFGQDTSPWANDGECDDPRFQGSGMATTPLLDRDIMADASDCQAAFNAGTITLVGGGVAPPTTSPGKAPPGSSTAPAGGLIVANGITFGDDSSEWSNDGECDDRRFIGNGVAPIFNWENIGHDATDCRTLYEAGRIQLWDAGAARAATQCSSIDFGSDAGQFPNDGECDDLRFEGIGMARSISSETNFLDASDCRAACELGTVSLRDY